MDELVEGMILLDKSIFYHSTHFFHLELDSAVTQKAFTCCLIFQEITFKMRD